MCAPSSVGAIEPVGMTNASTTYARKMKARMNATRIDSMVSLMFPSLDSAGVSVVFFAGAAPGFRAGIGAAAGVEVGGTSSERASFGMVGNRSDCHRRAVGRERASDQKG